MVTGGPEDVQRFPASQAAPGQPTDRPASRRSALVEVGDGKASATNQSPKTHPTADLGRITPEALAAGLRTPARPEPGLESLGGHEPQTLRTNSAKDRWLSSISIRCSAKFTSASRLRFLTSSNLPRPAGRELMSNWNRK